MAKYKHACDYSECGKVFYTFKSNSKFCSRECRSLAGTREITCSYCGERSRKPISDLYRNSKTTFCNVSCKIDYFKGSRSNLYNMGERYTVESTGSVFVWCGDKYRAEHRVLVEEFIGRDLLNWGEPILHIDGVNSNNKLSNLYVCSSMSEMRKILSSHDAPYPYRSNLKELKEASNE